MALKLLFNHNVPAAIPLGLRERGVDVRTAFEAVAHRLPDPALLDLAHSMERVLVTMDDDLLVEAAHRQSQDRRFSGVIYGHQDRCVIRQWIADFQLLAEASEPAELHDRVVYLPL